MLELLKKPHMIIFYAKNAKREFVFNLYGSLFDLLAFFSVTVLAQ